MSDGGNAAPSVKSLLQGKVITSQSREIVANVIAFMKREAEFGQQIPLRCVTKRVIAATGVSERSIRRIQREAEVVYSGGAPSFVSPRAKIKKRPKKVNRSSLLQLQETQNSQCLPKKLEERKDTEFLKEEDFEKRTDKMLYPSLEDMKVDQLARAQQPHDAMEAFVHQQRNQGISPNPLHYSTAGSAPLYPPVNKPTQHQGMATNPTPPTYSLTPSAPSAAAIPIYSHQNSNIHSMIYPTLTEYMGLELSPEIIAQNMPEYAPPSVATSMQLQPVSSAMSQSVGGMVAPLSGQSLGLQRAQVTHGIRELTLCKDAEGKVGLRVQAVNNGVFVCVVVKGSPAAMAGLRFGDQILQVNGKVVAGYTMDQVHKLFKESSVNGISVVVRDRPFERTVTLHKNSTGHVGFHFKNGKIVGLVEDSSAARNGLLTDHHVLEVNGQNVVGIPDKDITAVINEGGPTVTVTIIPSFVYDHMVTKMSSSLLKTAMDHSIPNV